MSGLFCCIVLGGGVTATVLLSRRKGIKKD